MRQIRMLAPFEVLRGNVSGSQKLAYPTKNNSAYEAPANKRSYANNYRPSYICAQRAKDGKTYFSVKKKSAVNLTAGARKMMALTGAGKVIKDTILQNLSTLNTLQSMYLASAEYKQGWTIDRWVLASVRRGLQVGSDIFFNAVGMSSLIFENPYKKTHVPAAVALNYPFETLVKFWDVLAADGITFEIDGLKGVAFVGEDFEDVMRGDHNVLGLSTGSVGQNVYVKFEDLWLRVIDGTEPSSTGSYVTIDQPIESIESVDTYYLDADAPEA